MILIILLYLCQYEHSHNHKRHISIFRTRRLFPLNSDICNQTIKTIQCAHKTFYRDIVIGVGYTQY